MENKEERKKYRRKLNALILLIAFTAIMLIVSTYAWFSTQRTVTLNGISGTVNVAEGLEISLDALNWSNALDLSSITNLKQYVSEHGYTTNNNIIPTEMLPVSTQGSTGKNHVEMYKGEAPSNLKLSKVTLCDEAVSDDKEDSYPAYIAFDVFLRDSSRSEADVPLFLTTDSTVTVKANGGLEEQYGLQNTIRVGFAKFATYANYKSDQKTILDTTAAASNNISQVSIWEPNANYHVNYTVINNNNFTVAGLNGATLRDNDGVVGTSSNVKFTRDDMMNTYALKDGSNTAVTAGIANVYAWGTGTTYFAKQNTVKTKITVPAYTDQTYVEAETYPGNEGYNMVGENADQGVALKDATDDMNPFVIKGNNVTRMRIYVWLEGQDVDCINYASHGAGITVNMGLQKAEASVTPTVGG